MEKDHKTKLKALLVALRHLPSTKAGINVSHDNKNVSLLAGYGHVRRLKSRNLYSTTLCFCSVPSGTVLTVAVDAFASRTARMSRWMQNQTEDDFIAPWWYIKHSSPMTRHVDPQLIQPPAKERIAPPGKHAVLCTAQSDYGQINGIVANHSGTRLHV